MATMTTMTREETNKAAARDGSKAEVSSGRTRATDFRMMYSRLIGALFILGFLSYGGGFVIIPLMHADAVNHYHWMTDAQFLNAVALGQVTPGPVTHTVAVKEATRTKAKPMSMSFPKIIS